jgi:hypothetical protein
LHRRRFAIGTPPNTETTAACPRCSIDAVVGDAAGDSIRPSLLSDMNRYWFDQPPSR